MTDCLFVYGTLMRAAEASELGRDMRERLGREARWLGPATTIGCLYDLGAYPALVVAKDTGEAVHGEVWQLRTPAATFEWLDPYEGLELGQLSGNEYARAIQSVELADLRVLEAYVYRYIGHFSQAQQIPDGRWHPTTG